MKKQTNSDVEFGFNVRIDRNISILCRGVWPDWWNISKGFCQKSFLLVELLLATFPDFYFNANNLPFFYHKDFKNKKTSKTPMALLTFLCHLC